jgi:hypothetical protein
MKMRDVSVEIGHSLNCCCWTFNIWIFHTYSYICIFK